MKTLAMIFVLLMGLPGIAMSATDFPGIYEKYSEDIDNGLHMASLLDAHGVSLQGEKLPLSACEKGNLVKSSPGSEDLDLSRFCDEYTLELWINRVPGVTGTGFPYDAEIYEKDSNEWVGSSFNWYRIQYQHGKIVESGYNLSHSHDPIYASAKLPNGDQISKELLGSGTTQLIWFGANKIYVTRDVIKEKELTYFDIPESNITKIFFQRLTKSGNEVCLVAATFTQNHYEEFYPNKKAFYKCHL